jgi:tryptophan 2,3-dioxygenase
MRIVVILICSPPLSVLWKMMEVDQYMKFRNTLTPASGFQSAQYRLIEFSSDLINLDNRFRDSIDRNAPTNMLLNIYIGKRQVKTMQRVKVILVRRI